MKNRNKDPTVDRIMPLPNNVHALIPRTHEYVTLHGTKGFADVIKSRILRQGDYPGVGPI